MSISSEGWSCSPVKAGRQGLPGWWAQCSSTWRNGNAPNPRWERIMLAIVGNTQRPLKLYIAFRPFVNHRELKSQIVVSERDHLFAID
jgi:hypothetical protein